MRQSLLLFFASFAFAQQSTVLQAPAPPPVASVTATASVAGNGNYCYWVVAVYPIGKSAAMGPACVSRVDLVTGTVTVTWNSAPGASSYDVLRTDPSASLPSGTANVALATGVVGNSATDTGAALSAYTISTVGPAQATLLLNNRDYAQPRITLDTPLQLPAHSWVATAAQFQDVAAGAPISQFPYQNGVHWDFNVGNFPTSCPGTNCALDQENGFIPHLGSPRENAVRIEILGNGTFVTNALALWSGNLAANAGSSALVAAAQTWATGQFNEGANILAKDCNRKNCNDPGATSYAAAGVVGIEVDAGASLAATTTVAAYLAEHSPDIDAMASNDFAYWTDNSADVLYRTIVHTGPGVNALSLDANARYTGTMAWTYLVRIAANGTPDAFTYTPFGTAAGNSGTDLVIGGTTTQVTSASHNAAQYTNPAIGFTNGDVGQVIQISAGTGCTVGYYTIVSASSGTATLDRSAGTAASSCTWTLWMAQTATATADTLTVQATTTNVVGTGHTFVAADVNQVVQITAQLTGTCNLTPGWYSISSVAAGVATLTASAGTAGSTCTYNLFTTATPLAAGPIHLTLPTDSTVAARYANTAIRPTATSYGVSIDWSQTTGTTVGDYWTWTVWGVPPFAVAYHTSMGSANTFGIAAPIQGGPNQPSMPMIWSANSATYIGGAADLSSRAFLDNAGILEFWAPATGGFSFGTSTTPKGLNFLATGAISAIGKITSKAQPDITIPCNAGCSVSAGNAPGMLGGRIVITNTSGATQTLTTATAAQLTGVIAGGCQVNQGLDFTLAVPSTNTGAITVAAGSGVTLDTAVAPWTTLMPSAANKAVRLRGLVTACTTPAVTLYLLGN